MLSAAVRTCAALLTVLWLAAGCASQPDLNQRLAMLRATTFAPDARVAVTGTLVVPPYVEAETLISAADLVEAEQRMLSTLDAELPAKSSLWTSRSEGSYDEARSVRLRTLHPATMSPASTAVDAELDRASAQGYRAYVSFTLYPEMLVRVPYSADFARPANVETRRLLPNLSLASEIQAGLRYPYSLGIVDASGVVRPVTREMRVQSVSAWVSIWRLPGKELVLSTKGQRTPCANHETVTTPARAMAEARPCLAAAGRTLSEALRYELSLR